jgi:hypothetical protein
MLTRDTFRLPGRAARRPLDTKSGGPTYSSCSSGQWRPPTRARSLSTGRESPPVMRGDAGAWGRGVLLLGFLALIFLAGCASPPRLVQGDSTSMSWYAKTSVVRF